MSQDSRQPAAPARNPRPNRAALTAWLALQVSVAALTLLVVGCGGPPVGVVTGSATLDGQPIALGTIALIHPAGQTATGVIRNGQFRVENVPVGDVTITLQSHELPLEFRPPSDPQPLASGEKQAATVVPARFADPARSGLRYTVIAGEQSHDIALIAEDLSSQP